MNIYNIGSPYIKKKHKEMVFSGKCPECGGKAEIVDMGKCCKKCGTIYIMEG